MTRAQKSDGSPNLGGGGGLRRKFRRYSFGGEGEGRKGTGKQERGRV